MVTREEYLYPGLRVLDVFNKTGAPQNHIWKGFDPVETTIKQSGRKRMDGKCRFCSNITIGAPVQLARHIRYCNDKFLTDETRKYLLEIYGEMRNERATNAAAKRERAAAEAAEAAAAAEGGGRGRRSTTTTRRGPGKGGRNARGSSGGGSGRGGGNGSLYFAVAKNNIQRKKRRAKEGRRT